MGRVSHVIHPEGEYFFSVKEWFLHICGGDHCCAVVLDVFEYWSNPVINSLQSLKSKETPWVTKRFQEISAQMLGLYSDRTITESLKWLRKYRLVIVKDCGPKFNQYYLNIPLLNELIRNHVSASECLSRNFADHLYAHELEQNDTHVTQVFTQTSSKLRDISGPTYKERARVRKEEETEEQNTNTVLSSSEAEDSRSTEAVSVQEERSVEESGSVEAPEQSPKPPSETEVLSGSQWLSGAIRAIHGKIGNSPNRIALDLIAEENGMDEFKAIANQYLKTCNGRFSLPILLRKLGVYEKRGRIANREGVHSNGGVSEDGNGGSARRVLETRANAKSESLGTDNPETLPEPVRMWNEVVKSGERLDSWKRGVKACAEADRMWAEDADLRANFRTVCEKAEKRLAEDRGGVGPWLNFLWLFKNQNWWRLLHGQVGGVAKGKAAKPDALTEHVAEMERRVAARRGAT